MAEQDLFKGITWDHIFKALGKINAEGYPPERRSSTYDLQYNETAYPPKYVLSLAGFIRNGKFIPHDQFSGGENSAAFAFLRNHGFQIRPKAESEKLMKAKEDSTISKKYLSNSDELVDRPEFFNQTDFTTLHRFEGQVLDRNNPEMEGTYQQLKVTYGKIEYLATKVMESVFPEGDLHIKKKPSNQANKFESYLWAKLYPTKELREIKSLAYTMSISSDDRICVKIDTVGLEESDPIRKKYLGYRGDFGTSKIVRLIKKEEVLNSDWDSLLLKTAEAIKSLSSYYDELIEVLDIRNTGNTEQEFLSVLHQFSDEHQKFFFSVLDSLLEYLKIRSHDNRVVFSCKSKRLVFKIGQRYAFALELHRSEPLFRAISPKKINATSGSFDGVLLAYLSEFESFGDITENLDAIKEGCMNELARTERSGFLGGNNPYFEKAVFDKESRNRVLLGSVLDQSKDIDQILRQFLDQANTYELKTSGYPKTYSGLTLKVSFGAGVQSKVPWIGFTNEFNSISNGIYPVILYYKRLKTLILAYGVSDTNIPARNWPNSNSLSTIDEWFKHNRNEKSDRYGESYVKAVYQIDGHEAYDQIQNDLNDLIREYKDIFVNMIAEPIGIYETTDSPFSREKLLKEIFLEEKEIDSIINLLQRKKNIILQGPPGVGKTFVAKRLAYLMLNRKSDHFIEMIQFHQSYSYEDFIQGYRPTELGGFDLRNGVFHQFCAKAKQYPDQPFFFIIDEINRGNLSKIFGELMMLLEHDKRGPEFEIPLTYSKTMDQKFYIPSNLYIIGTMNTADRSLALVDFALRRRFAFISLKPCFNSGFIAYLKFNKAPQKLIDRIITKIERLNTAIKEDRNLGPGFQIGHSFFTSVGEAAEADFQSIIENEIAPLLKEYWFDDEAKVLRLIEDLKA